MKPWKRCVIGLTLFILLIGQLPQVISAAENHSNADTLQPVFSLKIDSDKPQMGQEIRIAIEGERLHDLYAYEVNLHYDPDRLQFKKASSDIPGFTVAPIVKGGVIQFAHTKTGSVPGDNGALKLCTIMFTAIGEGNATVSLENVKLVNSKVEMVEQPVDAQATIAVGRSPIVLKDIAGHWAESAIGQAVRLGFVSGYEDHTFRPDRPVTRTEFVAMLVQALKLPLDNDVKLSFADRNQVPAWAETFVQAAVKHHMISGYENNTFRSEAWITRSEIATITVKALGSKLDPFALPDFADAPLIPSWAKPYVAAAVETGLMIGRGSNLFAPNEHATRAEAATLILALLQKI